MYGDKHVSTTFEGILYPAPEIIPDESNKHDDEDTGVVIFDFTSRQNIQDYVDWGNEIRLNSAFGITKENLLESARRHLRELYSTNDIILSDLSYSSETIKAQVKIFYKVQLTGGM